MPEPSPLPTRAAFEAGLETLLETHDGLGVFILAQANAAFDPSVRARLDAPLKVRFDALSTRLQSSATMTDADDDVTVFRQLQAIGLDALEPTQFRRVGPWEVQFNHLRALRPKRMADAVITQLHTPFDPAGFHFNKLFLRKEVFWSGAIAGHRVELLYNKFPFAPLHGILVPEREAELPQYLTETWHHAVWSITETLNATLPGVGFGYNAYGAFASVNHLHFQLFAREEPLPAQQGRWGHNGGDLAYPTTVIRHEDPHEAWDAIASLHAAATPYNLIYAPGHVLIFPRRYQGRYVHSAWTAGYAWYELGGGVTTFSRADFDRLGAADVAAELTRLQS